MALTNAQHQAKHRAKVAEELKAARRIIAEQEATHSGGKQTPRREAFTRALHALDYEDRHWAREMFEHLMRQEELWPTQVPEGFAHPLPPAERLLSNRSHDAETVADLMRSACHARRLLPSYLVHAIEIEAWKERRSALGRLWKLNGFSEWVTTKTPIGLESSYEQLCALIAHDENALAAVRKAWGAEVKEADKPSNQEPAPRSLRKNKHNKSSAAKQRSIRKLPMALIYEPNEPRGALDREKVAALAQRLSQEGLQIPITVRPAKRIRDGRPADIWEIIDGVHRFRAAQQIRWIEIEAVVEEGE